VDDLPSAKIALSVVIAAFNAEATLERCLLSLARQTLGQDLFEVVLVDDASTDGTAELARRLGTHIKNFTYVGQTENTKQGAARNRGIASSRGTYITFLDSDDFLRLDALEVALFAIGDADCLVFQHLFCRYDDASYRPRRSHRAVGDDAKLAALSGAVGWWPFGLVIKSEIINSKALAFPTGVFFEDIDFIVDLFSILGTVRVTNEALYYYVQSSQSTVRTISEETLRHRVAAVSRVRTRLLEAGVTSDDLLAFETAAGNWLIAHGRQIATRYDGADKPQLLLAFGLLIGAQFPHVPTQTLLSAQWNPVKAKTKTDRPYRPWGDAFEERLSGKVVFYCEVDYHIRAAASIGRQLARLSVPAVIIDASTSRTFTASRPLRANERDQYADLEIISVDVSETVPCSTSAAAFVFQNDLTYTKAIIFENFGIGVPTIGLYEGINDDLNVDRQAARRPYRSVDHLLLPGEFQRRFYADRDTTVVGLPNVRRLLSTPFMAGHALRAIINVNFTYGVIEENRNDFLASSIEACDKIGLPFVISQHPADKGDLRHLNVSDKSIYDLLVEGGVLVSRFSTTLLEAMALGRAAIYHNPIGERVEKFQEPLGAYQVTSNAGELAAALQAELKTGLGVDRRERVARFLDYHCNVGSTTLPEEAAAQAIAKIAAKGRVAPTFKLDASRSARGERPSASPITTGTSRKRGSASILVRGAAWCGRVVRRHPALFASLAAVAVTTAVLALLSAQGAQLTGLLGTLSGLAVAAAAGALGFALLRETLGRRGKR
jgi:hypothetical protein